MGTVSNVKVEPMNVTWGSDVAQVASITCAADVANSLDGKYFFVYTANNSVKYHVWFNTSGGSATDPNPGGSTPVEVALTTGDTSSAVATAVAAALEALAGFTATASNAVVTLTNAASGYATAPHDGNSNFTFAVTTEGDTAADVGFLDGNIELAVADTFADIMSHQTGADLLQQIITGKNVTMNFTLKETSVSQLRKVVLASGGASLTPSGAGPTEVFGLGQSKLFNTRETKKLVMHPVVLGAADKSRDLTFWKVALNFESIAYSGEELLTVPVTATVYPDTTKNAKVNKVVFGDGSQTLTA